MFGLHLTDGVISPYEAREDLKSSLECSSFANALKKATKGLSSSDADTTEAEELPSKRRKKSNRLYSSDEERSSSDDNDMLDYPCPPTNNIEQKRKNHSTDQSRQGFSSSSHGFEFSIESHLDETITAEKIELTSSTSIENKIDDLIKLVIKNNRIECQLGEDIKQITQLFPLKTEDDLNQLESIIKSTQNDSVDENKKKEDIQNQIVKCLSLDGSSKYKKSVRHIMSTVMLDQLAVLFSYKRKQKFYEKAI
ncbi:hypothetical protein FQA39_LY13336 [Lamprigera yunnana]|nr:hypothetical protein FQA39_LY13336 [Lamprigera yunnana]